MIFADNAKFMPNIDALWRRYNSIIFTKREESRYSFLLDAKGDDPIYSKENA
jgi:conserved phage-associated protein